MGNCTAARAGRVHLAGSAVPCKWRDLGGNRWASFSALGSVLVPGPQ